jgi:hypothetical protein
MRDKQKEKHEPNALLFVDNTAESQEAKKIAEESGIEGLAIINVVEQGLSGLEVPVLFNHGVAKGLRLIRSYCEGLKREKETRSM